MKMNRSSVVFEYRLISGFEEVRKKLLSKEFRDRLEKPLAHWALPTDRSAPIALMGVTIGQLLATPFEQIYATPGIGQKKIRALVELLNRAAGQQPGGALESNGDAAAPVATDDEGRTVDVSQVSEAVWVGWRRTIKKHDLGRETLGRYAPSLQNLPRVIWNTPLDAYLELTLADIRTLKTHGEKRVRAVLEVFGSLHALLSRLGAQPHLAVRVVPKSIAQIENWIDGVLQGAAPCDAQAIRRQFVDPLMRQLYVDAGDQIGSLAESRLRLNGSGATVRQVAERLDLTRARVYQLLNDVSAVTDVRWAAGHALVHRLAEKLHAEQTDPRQLELFDRVVDLFFPCKRHDGDFGPADDYQREPRAAHVG